MKHPEDQILIEYLTGSLSEDIASEIELHLEECEDCFERLKAITYLRSNFSSMWENVSLHEIGSVKEQINALSTVQSGENIREEKSGFIKSFLEHSSIIIKKCREVLTVTSGIWIGVSAVTAVIVLIVSLNIPGLLVKQDDFEKWASAGIITQKAGLKDKVGTKELASMLVKLAGKEIDTGVENIRNKKLLVRDAADAISACFKLDSSSKAQMLADSKPEDELTYSKAVELLDNFAGQIYGETGLKKNTGNLVINKPGMELKNRTVSGDLYLMQGIGSGEATLDNVRVEGSVYVLGGGMCSVIVKNSFIENMYVNKEDGKVRVFADKGTDIEEIEVQSGAKLEAADQAKEAFGEVTLSEQIPQGSGVILDGSFDKVEVKANTVDINVEAGQIKELTLPEDSSGVNVNLGKDAVVEKYVTGDGQTINKKQDSSTSNETSGDDYYKLLEKMVGSAELGKMEKQKQENYINELKVIVPIWKNLDKVNMAISKGESLVLNGYLFIWDNELAEQLVTAMGINTVQVGEPKEKFMEHFKKLFPDTATAEKVKDVIYNYVKNIIKLDEVNKLQSLNLTSPGNSMAITGIEPLRYFKNLRSLVLTDQAVRDFSYLKELDKLEELSIINNNLNNEVSDLSPIGTLTGLKKFTLQGSGVTIINNMSWLSTLKNLEELSLTNLNLPEYGAIGNLTGLRKLNMNWCIGFDNQYMLLVNLNKLEELKLYAMTLRNTSFLSAMQNLRSIVIKTKVNDFSGFRGLSRLETADIGIVTEQKELDFSPLYGLPSLKSLKIGDFGVPGEIRGQINQKIKAMFGNGKAEPSQVNAATVLMEKQYIDGKLIPLKNSLPNCQLGITLWNDGNRIQWQP